MIHTRSKFPRDALRRIVRVVLRQTLIRFRVKRRDKLRTRCCSPWTGISLNGQTRAQGFQDETRQKEKVKITRIRSPCSGLPINLKLVEINGGRLMVVSLKDGASEAKLSNRARAPVYVTSAEPSRGPWEMAAEFSRPHISPVPRGPFTRAAHLYRQGGWTVFGRVHETTACACNSGRRGNRARGRRRPRCHSSSEGRRTRSITPSEGKRGPAR